MSKNGTHERTMENEETLVGSVARTDETMIITHNSNNNKHNNNNNCMCVCVCAC